MLASTIANTSPTKPKGVRYRPQDFMPKLPIEQSPEQQLEILKRINTKVRLND